MESITYSAGDIARAVAEAANNNGWCVEVYKYAEAVSETLGDEINVTRRRAIFPARVSITLDLDIMLTPYGDNRWVAADDLMSEAPDESIFHGASHWTLSDAGLDALRVRFGSGYINPDNVTVERREDYGAYWVGELREDDDE